MGTVREAEIFVPGRVCLLGEHSDWAATFYNPERNPLVTPGRCLAYGTSVGLYTKATLVHEPYAPDENPTPSSPYAPTSVLTPPHLFFMSSIITNPNHGTVGEFHETRGSLDVETAKARAKDHSDFYAYAYGVIAVLLERYSEIILGAGRHGNANTRVLVSLHNYKTDLPVGKGLSSSAACCVTIARAFSELFGLKLTESQEMDIAYHGEIMTGSECGRLDQCVAYGCRAVDLHFKGHELHTAAVAIKPNTIFYFVVADLKAGKNTKKILHELTACFPDHQDEQVKRGVQSFLGQMSLDHVAKAIAAMEAGDVDALGAEFVAYQAHFDEYLMPACDELVSPKLHRVLADPKVQSLSCGGKGVGSQGDGTVQFLCRSKEQQLALQELLNGEELNCHAMAFHLEGPKSE